MNRKSLHELSFAAGGILAGAALVAAATPVLAQSTVEEVTVTGRYGPLPDNIRSISQTVSYADLDLGSADGRHELKHRISLTARYLCDKLGESDTSDPVVPSCRDAATRDADARAGAVIARFSSRGPTWVAGSRWSAPYPRTWIEKYP
jgi:UrcA family protein